MATQIIDLTNDFVVEREWFAQPATTPHWPKISPEDPTAANKANYIWTNALGKRDRFGLENLVVGFGDVSEFQYQFAYNGVAADNIPGVTLDFVIAPGVVAASVGPLNLNSSGADAVGQVTFIFNPALTEAEFLSGSIRHLSAEGAAGGIPDVPDFEE